MVLLMATEHYGDPQLGARLRALRLARGLTQKDLARPRYTHAYISTIEAGRRVPSQTALDFLAQKLGVDTEELELGRPKGSAERLRLQLEEARGDISSGNLDRALRTSNDVIRKAKEFRLGRVEARGYESRPSSWSRMATFRPHCGATNAPRRVSRPKPPRPGQTPSPVRSGASTPWEIPTMQCSSVRIIWSDSSESRWRHPHPCSG